MYVCVCVDSDTDAVVSYLQSVPLRLKECGLAALETRRLRGD